MIPHPSSSRVPSRPCPLLPAIAAITSTLLLLTACSGPGANSRSDASSDPTTLHYPNLDEPKRLDPAFVKDLYEGIVSGWIYDGLVGFGQGTDVEPRLAERWEVSPDGRTYTFHLREARYSDGKPVRAADVRYSFERVLHPATLSDRRWVLDRIEGAQEFITGKAAMLSGLTTPDDRTVIITLSRPSPVFLTMLAMPTGSIIREGAAGPVGVKPDESFDRNPVGTGPWVLTKWERDRFLEFRRNEHFWGNKPKLERLVYHVQVDDTVRRRQFEIGKFDIYQVGFQVWDSWRNDPTWSSRMVSVQELRTDFFGINTSKPALSDVRVRQALEHAIDKRRIFERLQRERGVLAHGPLPPGVPGYRADKTPREHDPEKASRLLAEAGVATQGDGRLRLEIWYREEALNSEIVQSAKADLEKLGIEVVPVARDQAALRSGIWEGRPDLFLGSWTLDYPDPEAALGPTFHSRNIPRQGNQAHFSDPETDRLIEAAQAETDPGRRIAAWQAVEQRVMEQVPWIPLFHRKSYYAVQPNVVGWKPALMYNADRFLDVGKMAK